MPEIHALFEELLRLGGSDLHLAVDQPPLARVGGEVVPMHDDPISAQTLEDILLELVTPAQRARLAANLDLDFAIPFEDVARFRASYYVKHSGIAAAFRLFPVRVPTLAEVGCPEPVGRLADRRAGLVLVVGGAASGKTTTMAALVDRINRTRACHIVTLDTPVEHVHEPICAQITQREIGSDAPTLATALRYVRREDPDVVVVSDISTPEEIEQALRLAADGLLVLATYQARGAAAAVDRLVTSFAVDDRPRVRGLLAECLAGIVAQELVRVSDSPSRLPIHEVLIGTPTIASLLRQGKTDGLKEAMMAGATVGMQTLDDALERLLADGRISAIEALDRSLDKVAFARAVARATPEPAAPLR